MLSKGQLLTITCFLGLFLVLYLGCDTKSSDHKALEKSRSQKFELISINRIINEAVPKLSTTAQVQLKDLEEQLRLTDDENEKVEYLRKVASIWYAEQQPLVSGHYAEQIAEIKNDVDSWSIAGTTYSIAAQSLKEGNERKHSIAKSREALETALSLSPENVDNKINLALTYVEAPLQDNPMKGIMMLVDLNKKYPESVPVLMQLGRLSLKTGQYDKAVERLTKVIELRPTFREAHCMLAEALTQKGESALAMEAQKHCNNK